MKDKLKQYIEEVKKLQIKSLNDLNEFKNKFLSKNGILNSVLNEFKLLSKDEKKEIGKYLNEFKDLVEKIWNENKDLFKIKDIKEEIDDLTRPPKQLELGAIHPLSIIKNKIIEIFLRMGYVVVDGPEIEDDWHVFSALNFPPDHPARDMQDTFFIHKDPDILLRTHTSSVQIRIMEKQKPPIRAIMPGRVYRNETISARSHCFFHQVEGLYVDEKVSFADLKQNLFFFVQEMFGKDVKVRFRPSFFPFTEPSAEMDISCLICHGSGCSMCKNTGWVEILGCGMVHPNVLENCNINSNIYKGFAFGMGIERITNLKFKVKDIRLFSENDLRFLSQFVSVVL